MNKKKFRIYYVTETDLKHTLVIKQCEYKYINQLNYILLAETPGVARGEKTKKHFPFF